MYNYWMIRSKLLQSEFLLYLIQNCENIIFHLIFNVVRADVGGLTVTLRLRPLANWEC